MKAIHRSIKTNLKGFKEECWHKNLTGFFIFDGAKLSDRAIRKIVDWGIENGCEYDTDIPSDKIIELIEESKTTTSQIISK